MMTTQQTKVLAGIATGQNIKTIAGDLGVSPKTVEYHWGNLKSLLRVQNYVEATHYAIARKLVPLLFALLLAFPATGSQTSLAWDQSPDAITNTAITYVLYAGTNSASLGTTNALRINVGTNLTATATLTNAATVYFAVTAAAGGVESDLSNIVIVQVPKAPPGTFRTIIPQFSATLSNWTNLGAFRLLITTP